MYFTDDSLYPENMQPLIITAAPYAPSWLPGDTADSGTGRAFSKCGRASRRTFRRFDG
jgi:hypothetical protein